MLLGSHVKKATHVGATLTKQRFTTSQKPLKLRATLGRFCCHTMAQVPGIDPGLRGNYSGLTTSLPDVAGVNCKKA